MPCPADNNSLATSAGKGHLAGHAAIGSRSSSNRNQLRPGPVLDDAMRVRCACMGQLQRPARPDGHRPPAGQRQAIQPASLHPTPHTCSIASGVRPHPASASSRSAAGRSWSSAAAAHNTGGGRYRVDMGALGMGGGVGMGVGAERIAVVALRMQLCAASVAADWHTTQRRGRRCTTQPAAAACLHRPLAYRTCMAADSRELVPPSIHTIMCMCRYTRQIGDWDQSINPCPPSPPLLTPCAAHTPDPPLVPTLDRGDPPLLELLEHVAVKVRQLQQRRQQVDHLGPRAGARLARADGQRLRHALHHLHDRNGGRLRAMAWGRGGGAVGVWGWVGHCIISTTAMAGVCGQAGRPARPT